ncbi:MAG TPA: VOC family protein [Chloroflexota bacterium]|nr:VOC family protein [Chloroflexota bacterium]
MPKVKKLAHVVLAVKDARKSMEWYQDVLGMEPMGYLEGINMGFLSFGEQHHDLALMNAPEGAALGSASGAHVAFVLEGGMDELKTTYARLKAKGVKVDGGHDFGFLNGFYFYDPDGNRLELFYDSVSLDEARSVLRKSASTFKRLDLNREGVGDRV